MASNKTNHFEDFRKFEVGNSYLYGGLFKHLKMAEIKGILFLFNTLGWGTFFYGFLIAFFNVDIFTRAVMGLLGIVFITVKIVDTVVTRKRKHEFEMIEIRMKKLQEKEMELKIRKEELDTYERENTIIKSYNGK